MTEDRVRERLRRAIGDAEYPPGLTASIEARLATGLPRRGSPWLTLAAAAVALLVISLLLAPAQLHRYAPPRVERVSVPAATPAPSAATASPEPTPTPSLPAADLDAGRLANVASLVSRPFVSVQDAGHTITLIGVYADSARIVVITRVDPADGDPHMSISDEGGLINSSSTGSRGIPGDYAYSLNAGAHAGTDGFAHLAINIRSLEQLGPGSHSPVLGSWSFQATVPVRPGLPLNLSQRFAVGAWLITPEVVEVTRNVVHVQLLIDGAGPGEMQPTTVEILDESGKPLASVSFGSAVTVPKDQLNAATARISRLSATWVRPSSGGEYKLRIENGASVQTIPLVIPPPP